MDIIEKSASRRRLQSPFAMVRRGLILAGLALFPSWALSQERPQSIAFVHATVIDGTGAAPQPDMTLVVDRDRITVMGKSGQVEPPAGARVVDASGQYLIPGLWDMHVHLSWTKASAIPALLANGVTGVRDAGGLLREIDEWRVRIDAGVMPGPRIIRAGPVLNGRAFAFHQFAVTNELDARGAVRALQKAGVDCIKVHRAIPREAYFGVAKECRELGLPLIGHIPTTVTPLEASQAGHASLEHVVTLFEGTFAKELGDKPLGPALSRFTHEAAAGLFAQFARNSTAFTPTLVSHRMVTQFGRAKPSPRDQFVSRSARKSAEDLLTRDKAELTPAFYERAELFYEAAFPLVRMMQEAGVRLLAGTDLATAGTYPGFDLHDELALMVEAGLTPMQALQAATRNPAQFLKLSDSGTIAPGQRADLVLLDADPLSEIRHTQRIRAVMAGGRFYDRDALDGLLRESARLAHLE